MTLYTVGGDFEKIFKGYGFDSDTAGLLFQRFDQERRNGTTPRILLSHILPSERRDAIWCWAMVKVHHYQGRLSDLREIHGNFYLTVRIGIEFVKV